MKEYTISYITKDNAEKSVCIKANNAIQAADKFFKNADGAIGANILEIKESEIMNEVSRSIEVIAGEINAIKSQTSGILSAAFTYARRSCFEIGKRLEEAKAMLSHGEWGRWLEDNFEYSESTAGNLMRIYREFGSEQIDMITGKSDAEIFEGLSSSQLVELFALPKARRAEFVEEHRGELESGEMSTRDMKREIKRLNEIIEQKDKEIRDNDDSYGELVVQKKAAEALVKDAEARAVAAEERASDLQLRIDELNERPLEVTKVTETVYEASPEQIEEIRVAALKEAEDKHGEDTAMLQAEVDKARAEVDKLKEKIKKAGKADEKKIAELEQKILDEKALAEKRIRQVALQSDPHTAKVSYCIEAISRAMSDINAEITSMNAEQAGSGDRMKAKCESMLLSLVNRLGWQI